MTSDEKIIIINSNTQLEEIFKTESQFSKINETRRAMGPPRLSEQIIFDNVDVQVPIYLGIGPIGTSRIEFIRSQIQQDFTQLVFNGGYFKSLSFTNFGLSVKEQNNQLMSPYSKLTLEIKGGEFDGPVRFINSQFNSIKISGGVFNSEVCFERGVYGNVEISGGDFKKGIYFGELINFDTSPRLFPQTQNIPDWTSKNNGIFSNIRINGILTCKDIFFNSCFIENEFLINSKDTKINIENIQVAGSIQIKECNCLISSIEADCLKVGGESITSKIILHIKSSHCNEIIFEGHNGKDSLINLQSQKCNSLKFEYFINYGGITFNDFELLSIRKDFKKAHPSKLAQALSIKNFYSLLFYATSNYGGRSMENILSDYEEALKIVTDLPSIEATQSIHFVNSDIGKSAFFGSLIDKSQLFFKNSKLTEIFLAGTELPKDINGFGDEKQKRLALSQVKKIYENRGDSVTAREYLSQELEVYRGELKNNKDWRGFHEGVSLWLNYISTSHGRDWFQSFYLLIGCGLFSWVCICALLKLELDLSLTQQSFSTFLKSSTYFFQFLLPIHKQDLIEEFLDKVIKIELTNKEYRSIRLIRLPIAQLLDVIWRIISGYLIYQLIAAFRKHGTK